MKNKLIKQSQIITLNCGNKPSIEICGVHEVSFRELTDRVRSRALEIGYAPSVNLLQNDEGYLYHPDSDSALWLKAIPVYADESQFVPKGLGEDRPQA